MPLGTRSNLGCGVLLPRSGYALDRLVSRSARVAGLLRGKRSRDDGADGGAEAADDDDDGARWLRCALAHQLRSGGDRGAFLRAVSLCCGPGFDYAALALLSDYARLLGHGRAGDDWADAAADSAADAADAAAAADADAADADVHVLALDYEPG